MNGIFYSRPAIDKEAFVKKGETLKNGDTVGLIEVMKSFYPIVFTGENGEVVLEITAKDGDEILENQPLIYLK